jgi:hypothetical protein
MARSKDVANNTSRHGQRSANDRDDDDGRNNHHDDGGSRNAHASNQKSGKDDRSSRRDDDRSDDSHGKKDSHGKHESCRKSRDDDDDRYEVELDLDKRSDGIDLEVEVERDGRWLEVEVEIGSMDIDLKVDARKLQPDTSPMVATVAGEGTAIGQETLVDADMFCRLIDYGSVTVAFGRAEFQSVAVADDGLAFATADTFADISGADLVLVFTQKVSTPSDGSGSYVSERSTTSYIAIDFEEFDFCEGPLVLDSQYARTYLDQLCGKTPAIDGNVATLDVDAQVLGENTLVDVLSSVLTIEDQLSTVSAMAVSAVG